MNLCVVRDCGWVKTWCMMTCVLLQVRDSDETDPAREKSVQLLDDFKISGVNGTRILSCGPKLSESIALKFECFLFFCTLLLKTK